MTGITDTQANYPGGAVTPTKVLTSTFKSSGKYYLEFVTTSTGNGGVEIGFAPSTYDGEFATKNQNDYFFYPYLNQVYIDGFLEVDYAGNSVGSTIGVAYDIDTNTVEVFIDNVSLDSRSYTPGVAVSPMARGDLAVVEIQSSTTTWSGFTYTPPSGHIAWPSS